MRTYHCDRCGEKMPRKAEPFRSPKAPISKENLEQGATLPLPLLIEGGFDFPGIDLCGPCIESLWKWLARKTD